MICDYDIAVIGAGLLGCFVARSLARYNWRVAVFEKNSDVCTGMSKANTAIIYPGYDNKPGSLKAKLCANASRDFDALCGELDVRYRRTGSMMVAFGPGGERVLEQKFRQGQQNGVENLRMLETAEILELEPNINKSVTRALYAETTATVNPWELCIAAYENAVSNGVAFYFESEVTAIRNLSAGYELTAGTRYRARAVVNCTGLFGAEVSELANSPKFRLDLSIADYLLLDEHSGSHVKHIIMHEPEQKGRGATLVPTVDGNLLLGPSKVDTDDKTSLRTTREGCEEAIELSEFVFPELPTGSVIRSFATVRPSTTIVDSSGYDTGERVHDLMIYETENPGFINLAGIRTPGLTCCDEIGRHVSDMLLERLGNPGQNTDYCGTRKAPSCDDALSRIVCRCRKVTEGEIVSAIRRTPGVATLDGVKRRTGANMGRCQGGFCTQRILELIARETGRQISEIRKNERGSEILRG